MASELDAWLARLEGRHPKSIELGLDRVARVRDRLGIDLGCPVLTVGGTNGKGSVCAYLGAILEVAGYRAGVYTSPHLLHFTERIVIAGEPVTEAALLAALDEVEQARGDIRLTYFEHTTLAALRLFERAHLDALVLEVGLGGRLDAVNCVDPDCAVVASVDIDHQEYLGETREEIGFEKAGIFRAGRPAISLDPDPPASLLRHAEEIGARLIRMGADIEFAVGADTWQCRVGETVFPALPKPALRGRHQYLNAAGAIATLTTLRDRLPVPQAAVRSGLARTVLPGRFQIIGLDPTRILDVAHNPHAARSLADLLADLPARSGTRAVFAMLADKDVAGVIEVLRPYIDFWHVAPLQGPRGASAERLAEFLDRAGSSFRCHNDVRSAWKEACREAEPADTIVAFGSFLTIAEILASEH